ncbi:hypothetical protein ANCCEY_08956 [Ancylostoma ceylanicum]|uniref:Uncharacterized protein n=1 Tax=Ancylostoma ceylanicum TaxID=53326 RepID=A0A0D6LIV1_9BILA|nr:hypothetical protein ANCCEY_08956 [Ancylostoma ceylanicum]
MELAWERNGEYGASGDLAVQHVEVDNACVFAGAMVETETAQDLRGKLSRAIRVPALWIVKRCVMDEYYFHVTWLEASHLDKVWKIKRLVLKLMAKRPIVIHVRQ